MPSPRKRRLKRAAGVVLGKGHKITKAQGADKQFIRSLVSLNGAKDEVRGSAPFKDGHKPAGGDFEVLSGLVHMSSDLDMQATCKITITNALVEDDDHITLEDAEGTVVKILTKTAAEGVEDGDEILDNEGKSLSPRTFIIEATTDKTDDAAALEALINAMDIKIHAAVDAVDDTVIHLAQEIAGPAGNKAVSAVGDIDLDANVTGFGGGCRARDAKHYLAEENPKLADNSGTIESSHGVMWIENPRHGLNGLVDLSGANDNIAIDPGINDGLNGALVSGQAADRLHYKIIMKGGAIVDTGTVDAGAGLVSGAHPGFATAAADAVADAGVITLMQKVVAGDTSLAIDPAAPAAGNDEKDEDFLPSKDGGLVVHWFLERISA